MKHLKPGCVLLNFARGELVDSNAMKDFLDRADGRYISDFPDDVLWDHKNAIILPHLGASTEEAEDQAVRHFNSSARNLRILLPEISTVRPVFSPTVFPCFGQAAMAADTIREFLEHGK
jgi:phosphoglycerate dehydrogenase-like enzyme